VSNGKLDRKSERHPIFMPIGQRIGYGIVRVDGSLERYSQSRFNLKRRNLILNNKFCQPWRRLVVKLMSLFHFFSPSMHSLLLYCAGSSMCNASDSRGSKKRTKWDLQLFSFLSFYFQLRGGDGKKLFRRRKRTKSNFRRGLVFLLPESVCSNLQ
jgi:hypothetical protein